MTDQNGKEIKAGQRVAYQPDKGPSSMGTIRKIDGKLWISGQPVIDGLPQPVKEFQEGGGKIWVIPSKNWRVP